MHLNLYARHPRKNSRQLGWGFERPGLVEGEAVHGRGVATS